MDQKAIYTQLLKAYTSLIWSMCHKAAHGNYEQCRDLFQDVSLRLWIHIGELNVDARPYEKKAWVEWQTRHVLNHATRRQRPEPMSVMPEQSDADTMADAELHAFVDDLLSQLHPDERQLMQMRIEGYSAGEIAQKMGLSRNTVYQRMHRILKKAKRFLIVIALLIVASTITVAVVPSWRQLFFSSKQPTTVDSLPASKTIVPAPAPVAVTDSIIDDHPIRRTWVCPDSISHLIAVTDTLPVLPPPSLNEPCDCPPNYRRKTTQEGIPDLSGTSCEHAFDGLPKVTIRTFHENIVVAGAVDEIVDVFDEHGRIVATAQCKGICVLNIRPERHSYSNRNIPDTYWVQVGNHPRQRVFLHRTDHMIQRHQLSPTPFLRIN